MKKKYTDMKLGPSSIPTIILTVIETTTTTVVAAAATAMRPGCGKDAFL